MPNTFINSRLLSNKQKLKIKPELNDAKSKLPPNLQSFKQNLISGKAFLKYN